MDEIEEEEPEAPVKRRFDQEKTREQIIKKMKESLMPPSDRSIKLSLGATPVNSNNPR